MIEFEKINSDDFENYKKDDNKDDENKGIEFISILEDDHKKEEKEIKIPRECSDKKNLLKIIAYPTNKHKIKQRPFMKADIIPRHSSSVIFNGSSGSGKTNLVVNLLTRPEFYGRTKKNDKKSAYFDLVFLFSPTAYADDLVKFLKIPKKRIFQEFNEKTLNKIISTQESIVAEKSLINSPKILIIFEDIQSDSIFMNSKSFLKCFIQCRHINITTFLLSQHFNKTPKACRQQANNIFFFPGSQSAMNVVVDEFAPPKVSKKQFLKLCEHATDERYSFLHINMRCPPETRFRKNLDKILNVVNSK